MTKSTYNEIALTLGHVCLWWAHIEYLVHDVVLHLAVCHDAAFDKPSGSYVLNVALSNTDMRQKIETARLLTHMIGTNSSPTLYDRTVELFNFLESDLRPERNRYVHDIWHGDESGIVRVKMGAKVIKPQAFKREMVIQTEKRFADVAEVKGLVTKLEAMIDDLVDLDNHLAWFVEASAKVPQSISPQPLPAKWRSLSHKRTQPHPID